MTKSFRRDVCSVVGALCLAVSYASADVIYNNTTTDLNYRLDPDAAEVGDEVLLTSTGFLTNFSFQYFWEPTGSADNAQARVRFYMNNGSPVAGYPSPNQQLYDSGWFNLGSPSSSELQWRSTVQFLAGVDFALGGLFLPVTDITWTVQFQGYGDDNLGLTIYNPPTVGSNFDDFWTRPGATWQLQTNSIGETIIPMNFAARFEANIPEPSSISLLLLGGIGYFLSRRNKK